MSRHGAPSRACTYAVLRHSSGNGCHNRSVLRRSIAGNFRLGRCWLVLVASPARLCACWSANGPVCYELRSVSSRTNRGHEMTAISTGPRRMTAETPIVGIYVGINHCHIQNFVVCQLFMFLVRLRPGHQPAPLRSFGWQAPKWRRFLTVNFQTAEETSVRYLAARCARAVQERLSLERQRAQGMPGARCTRSLACKGEVSTQA